MFVINLHFRASAFLTETSVSHVGGEQARSVIVDAQIYSYGLQAQRDNL